MFICFLIMGTFPGWHEEQDEVEDTIEVKPFPVRRTANAAVTSILAGSIFAFISILWQHLNTSATASMIETLSYGGVTCHVGPAAMSLAWIAVALIMITGLGLSVMMMSISLIRRLTEED